MFPSSHANRNKRRKSGSHRELHYHHYDGKDTITQSKILQDVCVCLTGISAVRKDELHSLVSKMGGSYLRDLVTQYVTHLVAEKPEGEKYQQAQKCPHIEIVTPDWLEVCAAKQMRVPESEFHVSQQDPSHLSLHDEDQVYKSDFFNDMRVSLDKLLLPDKVPPNFLFSNCCFYLVGFPPMPLHGTHDTVRGKTLHVQPCTITFDVCRLIRRCMGTIYWKVHKNISHVIVYYDCDLKTRNEVNNLCRNHPNSPSAISPQWILASVERRQIVDVAQYPPMQRKAVNTLKVKRKKSQSLFFGTNSNNNNNNNIVKSSIFEGKFFYISNVPQQDALMSSSSSSSNVLFSAEKVERVIVSHGGRILSREGIRILQKVPSGGDDKNQKESNGKERVCYVIHLGGSFDLEKILQNDAILGHVFRKNLCKIVPTNPIWLQTCDAASLEIPPSRYETLFVPVSSRSMKRLKKDVKIKVAVTGFVGVERMAIRMAVLAIGGDCTENMSRDNTHLICKEASGPKYVKAVEWNLQVVTIEWLHHIVYSGYESGCEKSYSIQHQVDNSEIGTDTMIQ